MVLTIGQDAGKKGTSGYFYYNPENKDANVAIQAAINAAGNGETIQIKAGKTYWINHYITFKSNITLLGEDNVTIKLSDGLPCGGTTGGKCTTWGGHGINGHEQGGAFQIYKCNNVTISKLAIDGSWDDIYGVKYDSMKGNNGRGRSELNLIMLWQSSDIKIDQITFFHGANDGIGCYTCNDIEVCYCRFDMIGHDCLQCASTSSRIKFHHNFCRLRTNCGVRFSYGTTRSEAYCNEFVTGVGGSSGVELQRDITGTLVYNNYFHDINHSGWGAIGYKGQEVSGTGVKFYNNLIVNCGYAVNNCPSGYEAYNNIALKCGSLWNGSPAKQTPNVTQESEYTAVKHGENGQCNTYWEITGGLLTGQIVGIDPKYGLDISTPMQSSTPVQTSTPTQSSKPIETSIQIPKQAQVIDPRIAELLQTCPCIVIPCENLEIQQKLFDSLKTIGLLKTEKMEIAQVQKAPENS